ncbi:MAG: hypothetical protein AB7T09_37100, partial [Planctomycetota bacterium]
MLNDRDRNVARLLLQRGLVTPDAMRRGGELTVQRRQRGEQVDVLQVLVEMGALDRGAASQIWRELAAVPPPPAQEEDAIPTLMASSGQLAEGLQGFFGPPPTSAEFGPPPVAPPGGAPFAQGAGFGPPVGASGSFGPSPGMSGSFGPSPGMSGSFGPSPGMSGSFGPSPGASGSFGPSPGMSGSFGPSPGASG